MTGTTSSRLKGQDHERCNRLRRWDSNGRYGAREKFSATQQFCQVSQERLAALTRRPAGPSLPAANWFGFLIPTTPSSFSQQRRRHSFLSPALISGAGLRVIQAVEDLGKLDNTLI